MTPPYFHSAAFRCSITLPHQIWECLVYKYLLCWTSCIFFFLSMLLLMFISLVKLHVIMCPKTYTKKLYFVDQPKVLYLDLCRLRVDQMHVGTGLKLSVKVCQCFCYWFPQICILQLLCTKFNSFSYFISPMRRPKIRFCQRLLETTHWSVDLVCGGSSMKRCKCT